MTCPFRRRQIVIFWFQASVDGVRSVVLTSASFNKSGIRQPSTTALDLKAVRSLSLISR